MHAIDTIDAAVLVAAASRAPCLVVEAPLGADLSPLAGTLPAAALDRIATSGASLIRCDGDAEAVIAYTDVERRLCLVPGMRVVLARSDGEISSAQRQAVVVEHDFTPPARIALAA